MKYNSQLYQEYLESRKECPSDKQMHKQKRRVILQQLIQQPDEPALTLESSINVLQKLGMITSIRSLEHLYQLSEYKKNSGEGWYQSEIQLWQCRLISFLWSVIGEQSIEVRYFKEVLMILLNQQQHNRQQQLVSLCGENQQIQQLLWAWDHLFKEGINVQEQISDISIIKTKNQAVLSQNKQNCSVYENGGYRTERHQTFNKNGHCRSKSKLDKSYQKRTVKTTIDRNGSAGYITSKRSQANNLNNYISEPISNFFREGQSLTIDDEKRLVDRLYKVDRYVDREVQKNMLDEERMQRQLSQCTFKPNISRTSKSASRITPTQRNIKGYQKAIERMKSGYQKQKEYKQNMEYRVWKKKAEMSFKPTQPHPPKFHSKAPKQPIQDQLFTLQFTIGKNKITIKVKKSDKIQQLVARAGKIYSLKPMEIQYIMDSLLEYMENYCSEEYYLQESDI